MTALRQSAMIELEKIPEDKLSFVIQIMQGVNGLYNDSNKERKEAFARLEQLRKKGTVADDANIQDTFYANDKALVQMDTLRFGQLCLGILSLLVIQVLSIFVLVCTS